FFHKLREKIALKQQDRSEQFGGSIELDESYFGGGMSNSISILELFSILESELDINLSYYVTPWRSNDQKVFVADTGKAYNDFLWKPIIDKITGIEKMIEWVDSNN
ncbi:MAG: hypothetical protein NZ735_06600, partial [Candidatus Marinimicrobia bacterium]|nr:hypothetical protein [Candidatus Neomarinimicrobiota bacterium]